MSISGHKTENAYRRYEIVAERDLSDAATRLNEYFTKMKNDSKKAGARPIRALWAHFWAHQRIRRTRKSSAKLR